MPSAVVEIEEDTTIPDGTKVRLEFIKCEERTVNFTDKAGSPASFVKFSWRFRTIDNDPEFWNGKTIFLDTAAKFTSMDREDGDSPRQIMEALLAKPLGAGDEISTEDAEGLECLAVVRWRRQKNDKKFMALTHFEPLDEAMLTPPF